MSILRLSLVLALLLSPRAFASDGVKKVVSKEKPTIVSMPITSHILSFRLSEVTALQETGNSFSGAFSWNPEFSLSRILGVVGNLGVSQYKSPSSTFLVTEYQLLLSIFRQKSWSGEIGGGIQTWFDTSTSAPAVSSNIIWRPFAWKERRFPNRVYLGYTAFLLNNNFTNEIKVGVGFNL